MRLLVMLPLMAVLIGIYAPLELVGNFQHVVRNQIDPNGFIPIFAWDKFLEGGGNSTLALVFAAIAIALTSDVGREISLPNTTTPAPHGVH